MSRRFLSCPLTRPRTPEGPVSAKGLGVQFFTVVDHQFRGCPVECGSGRFVTEGQGHTISECTPSGPIPCLSSPLSREEGSILVVFLL